MMPLRVIRWNSKDFLLFVLVMQFTLDAAVLFNIPVVRQVIGFLCLTFVPGLIIFKLLKFDESDILELVLFSVGFSVAFLMLGGLLANEFGFLLGVSQSLSLVPLLIILNSLMFVGAISVYLRSGDVKIWKSQPIEKSPFVILFICLPILSIVGAIYMTAYGNNLLLLFTIVSIAVLFIIAVLSKRVLPPSLYPLAIAMIAIAILFHTSFISNYIVSLGSDVPGECIIFQTVENNGRWISTLPLGIWYGRMNAMLSITILPTFYANILNISSDWVFKLLYPLIFSLVPLGLYRLWQDYIDKRYAFISVFLFIAFETFYFEMLGLSRQIIAELFFVLLFLVILNKKMAPTNKMISFIIFSFALVASHYSLAEIFVIFIACTFIALTVLKRPSKRITLPMVLLFLVIMFAWYIYTSGSATFASILDFGNYVYGQLGNFLNPASRGATVLTGLGLAESPSVWNTVSRIFAYFTQGLIVLGTVALLLKRTPSRVEREYFIFSLMSMAVLALLIIVPGLANTLNMTRFYHILLFFLAPLCVIGADFVVRLLFKRKRELVVSVLLLTVLVPYFLFQTEFVFEVTGSESWSIPLSGYRMSSLLLYGHYGYSEACGVNGARWLSKNTPRYLEVYADEHALANILRTYGYVFGGTSLSNTSIVEGNSIVYLSKLNVVYGKITFGKFLWNTSELAPVFNDLNVIYANGGSEIRKPSY